MPRKSKKVVEEKVEEVVIVKPKRGRKKKVVPEPEPASPIVDSQPAPVPAPKKKRVRKSKKVQETPVVEEVKVEEVKEAKTKTKKPKALKVDNKASEPKKKRAPSKWLIHVNEFRKKNPDLKYSEVLKKAKDTYVR